MFEKRRYKDMYVCVCACSNRVCERKAVSTCKRERYCECAVFNRECVRGRKI